VATKFDLVVSEVLFDIAGGDTRLYERARDTAHAKYEESRRSLFRGKLKDVPVEIVSTKQRHDDLLERLITTTHKLIMADSRNAGMLSISSKTGEGNFQINPVSFALSVEQRVNHNLIIQASIEIGRSRYWRSLWSSHDFTDQPLKNCIDVVHTDIVDVWRLRDSDGYLLSTEFKTKMSNLVKTLAEPLTTAPPRPKGNIAPCGRQVSIHEACNLYRNKIENIRYMVGYIVDLIIILHGLFVSTHNDVSACKVQEVINHHVESGLQKRIHHDIRCFITDGGPFTYRGNDIVVEKMIDLIKKFCVPLQQLGVLFDLHHTIFRSAARKQLLYKAPTDWNLVCMDTSTMQYCTRLRIVYDINS